jgi:integrase
MSPPPLTYGQAFSALLFLYREVLKVEFDAPLDSVRAKKPARLPVVLTRAEAQQVLEGMTGTYQLMAKLLYGSGLRLTPAPAAHRRCYTELSRAGSLKICSRSAVSGVGQLATGIGVSESGIC